MGALIQHDTCCGAADLRHRLGGSCGPAAGKQPGGNAGGAGRLPQRAANEDRAKAERGLDAGGDLAKSPGVGRYQIPS
jgi:hypothetical protein